jgi:hypothetical protein
MRLHLLQAVVLFHQNRRQEASKLLARADSELSLLKVDDCSLSTLMELGVYIHLWNSLLFFLLYRVFTQLLSSLHLWSLTNREYGRRDPSR